MVVYLASPGSQLQADYCRDMPVLLSYAPTVFKHNGKWLGEYIPSFERLLIDSGAYSELNGTWKVEVTHYAEWTQTVTARIDAVAGLDDISGDWRRSLSNYEAFPQGFPTFHDTDPPELLDDLIPMAQERGGWLGIGLKPPRQNKEKWLRATCDRIPPGLHVHGWALRQYTHVPRLDSVDSTAWFRNAQSVKQDYPWLTPAECLEIIVKRYKRWQRVTVEDSQTGFNFEDEL